ncbi:SDR family oxidoreductase, partial [Gammaproteobacteria bacterium]|nr:SDR family oxidoreductase [Gammaproteobacteria bacterium]
AFSRRTKENADTDSLNWVVADVTNKESLAEALKNVDVIISAIGPVDGDNSENVDYLGAINIVSAAKESGVQQIIYMSSIGAGGAENISTVMLNLLANKTMKWKALAEEQIRSSGIAFTIVRPGGLLGEPATQGIQFSQGDNVLGWIPREDVAAVLVESIFKNGAKNKTFEVINDDSLPVDAWRDEFDSLKPNEFGVIATGELPTRYWLSPLLIIIAIIYLIRRKRARS